MVGVLGDRRGSESPEKLFANIPYHTIPTRSGGREGFSFLLSAKIPRTIPRPYLNWTENAAPIRKAEGSNPPGRTIFGSQWLSA